MIQSGLRELIDDLDRQLDTLTASVAATRTQRARRGGLYPFSDRDQQELELRESQLVLVQAMRWLLEAQRAETRA